MTTKINFMPGVGIERNRIIVSSELVFINQLGWAEVRNSDNKTVRAYPPHTIHSIEYDVEPSTSLSEILREPGRL